jgi:wee1-like protein kinase
MNEVFAHAALMKHKHIVQYYNSWVENGRIYIQNEYCEGGSLANAIRRKRSEGRTFSENELKRIVLHLAKGLM